MTFAKRIFAAGLVAILLGISVLGFSTCTWMSWSGCPTTGLYAGPPTLQAYVQGAGLSLPAAAAQGAGTPTARIIVTAQIGPAGEAFMTADPSTCGGSSPTGTCYYNVIGHAPNYDSQPPSGIIGYIYGLTAKPPNGVGLQELDVNLWMSPLFESAQWSAACTAFGGGSCSPTISGGTAAWYSRGLATYDAMFSYLASIGVRVNAAFEPSIDLLAACNITRGAGNYTETQIQNCEGPLIAAAAKRWKLNHSSVHHEPCGVQTLIFGVSSGCYLSVGDVDTLIVALAAAARWSPANAGMLVGAGYILSEMSYWTDMVTNLMAGPNAATLDYGAAHFYPDTAVASRNFVVTTLPNYASMCAAIPAGKICLADEGSTLRWSPLVNGGGEGGTYLGCGSREFSNDGTVALFYASVIGAWAPQHGYKQFSIFPTWNFFYLSDDVNNTHCSQTTDNYTQTAMSNLGNGITPEGLAYAKVAAGYGASILGRSNITGRGHIGH